MKAYMILRTRNPQQVKVSTSGHHNSKLILLNSHEAEFQHFTELFPYSTIQILQQAQIAIRYQKNYKFSSTQNGICYNRHTLKLANSCFLLTHFRGQHIQEKKELK